MNYAENSFGKRIQNQTKTFNINGLAYGAHTNIEQMGSVTWWNDWETHFFLKCFQFFSLWSIDILLLNYIIFVVVVIGITKKRTRSIDSYKNMHTIHLWMVCCYPLIVLNCFINKHTLTLTHRAHMSIHYLIKVGVRNRFCELLLRSFSSSSKIITFFFSSLL